MGEDVNEDKFCKECIHYKDRFWWDRAQCTHELNYYVSKIDGVRDFLGSLLDFRYDKCEGKYFVAKDKK
jgi:hypothetical protein